MKVAWQAEATAALSLTYPEVGPTMFAIIGIVLVFGAVVGGYLMEHGNLKVLMQPAELLIIGGAGMGTLLTANPPTGVISPGRRTGCVFGSSKFDKGYYESHSSRCST